MEKIALSSPPTRDNFSPYVYANTPLENSSKLASLMYIIIVSISWSHWKENNFTMYTALCYAVTKA